MTSFSETYVSFYDFNTESIGPYHFKSPIPWLQEWHNISPPMDMHYLYKALYHRKGALAVFVLNTDLIVTLYQDKVTVTEPGTDRYDVFTPEVGGILQCAVPIGYVKTYSPCPSVNLPPYRLPFNVITNKAHLHGKWIDIGMDVSVCEDIEVYKKLLNTEYDSVYMRTNGALQFL